MTLHKVLQRLREYITLKQCPFPHVMRTGAVFIPMLVVKELLFPQVQGSFIDQVLQEHKVNLRPTTLSEEKSLTELCKRSCSNKLKRLLSLKHLPDIYPDVVSLFYHACVHKHLAVELDEPAKRHPDEDSKETDPSKSSTYSDIITSSLGSGSDEPRQLEDQKKNSQLNKHRTKGWVKSRSGHSVLEDEGVKCTVQLGDENVMPTLDERQLNQVKGIPEENPSHITPQEECEYLCPLSSDELGSSTSDTEIEGASTLPGVNQSATLAKCQERSKNHPGMILKLKKVSFNKDHHSRRACYQPVSTTGTVSNPSFSEAKNGQRKQTKRSKGDPRRKITSRVTHRWQITKRFSHALRLLSSSSPRRHQPLIKIKYCPFLSTFHSAEHRRRWVLRSAVQRARQAMTFSYPDLVGKRIQHLYEEDDKSEVWYRGEVVCIHEAHPNPLKTVFEVRYDSEPEWKYYLELLIDYKKGWLKID
ncbi:uncharacterized protein C15orf39 homolog [Lampris incognitus]|uniref:uncharacterized protein C15orf39 homolog n=1 Tax=Lampris incognitus TaxID=2546036 RepID=UPI0024B4E074|nr:uncharacterized protein C15orf39 homolog [Lampris incognitus]